MRASYGSDLLSTRLPRRVREVGSSLPFPLSTEAHEWLYIATAVQTFLGSKHGSSTVSGGHDKVRLEGVEGWGVKE